MITKSEARKLCKKTILDLKLKGEVIEYPMVNFRHAIFVTVERCKAIQSVQWSFDSKNELSMCKIFYQSSSYECIYDYRTNKVEVIKYENKEDTGLQITKNEMMIEDLPDYIHQSQPKVKIVLKKKV